MALMIGGCNSDYSPKDQTKKYDYFEVFLEATNMCLQKIEDI